MKYIYVGEELILTSVDGETDGGCESPEDMIWGREIRDIFFAGVKAGRKTKNDSEIEVLDKEKGE